MRLLFVSIVILLAVPVFGAERVVLIEDFTNCGCSYCWNFEPALNGFVNTHLASGEIAVIRVHVNWPYANDPIYQANPTEQNARKSAYGVNGVPWVQVDGKIHASSSGPGLESALSSRIGVPSYLDIFVARNGDDQTGNVSIGLVAEEDLGLTDPIRLFATIVEDQVPGVQYWAGSYFEQAFRDNLFGVAGPLVEFQAPYPDTVYFQADYDISSWVSDNLYLAVFVQKYTSADKEVLNARWYKFMDLMTGIEGGAEAPVQPDLVAGPNPSNGTIMVTPVLPDETGGYISVYDLSGRQVAGVPALNGHEETFELPSSGIYIVRLVTGSGMTANTSLVVLK
ncbi:MAG: hypothetical protein AVO35_12155 [Candidatus Aegiribacteria sp. MLS_C]|nr:MAG: hypothetical protein AVO35_12155 [Candidatus Aegiribacteria sp. MLS_C]